MASSADEVDPRVQGAIETLNGAIDRVILVGRVEQGAVRGDVPDNLPS